MDELFEQSPVFVPGSKWVPSSHLDEDAERVARGEDKVGEVVHEEVAFV
jgi:hypothetical protein